MCTVYVQFSCNKDIKYTNIHVRTHMYINVHDVPGIKHKYNMGLGFTPTGTITVQRENALLVIMVMCTVHTTQSEITS